MLAEHQRSGHQIHEQGCREVISFAISFAIADLTKTAHPGKKRSIYYPSLKEDETLCPVNALNEYLRHTEQRREEDQAKTRLLLSVVKPYKPVVNLPLQDG